MTIQLFAVLFAVCAAATSLATEAIKKTFSGSVSNNLIVLGASVVIGGFAVAVTYLANDIEITALNIMYAVAFIAINWLGATLGYDKIKQTLEQLRKGGE